ncbi:MAG: geranylgeranylglyceryl/heptaprenylglyceryl phosphate synthase [candidate division Zixibacteria bacterium]
MNIYDKLLSIRKRKTGFAVLLDPDKKSPAVLAKYAKTMETAGADVFLIGSSLMMSPAFDKSVRAVKKAVKSPLIIFPNSSGMLSGLADAVLFTSLISGRNPNLLIGEQVKAAPAIKSLKLEVIPTGYILIESGNLTSVGYLSNTFPIPRNKPEIVKAHALAAEYLGMKLVYLEAGSGAAKPISPDIVKAVKGYINLPIIVGGGITDPSYARRIASAGASFIVVGNVLERDKNGTLARTFAEAIHNSEKSN